jgi:ABC-2 type transport system permease protein
MLGGLAILISACLAEAAQRRPPSGDQAGPGARLQQARRTGIVRAFADEYGRVLRDSGAFGLIVLAPIIYGVFYPAALSWPTHQGHPHRRGRR